jgi:hypothetical protein
VILAALALAAALDAAAQVQALDWLAGTWERQEDGEVVREVWLAPRDGAMAGVAQTTRPGKPAFVEFMTITAEAEGATFTAVIQGQPPTRFVMRSHADGEATFENLAHDYPQRVIYRRCDADLCARIEGSVAGEPRAADWRYRRTPAP